MQCDRFREAISARIDGEDPGLPDKALDVHLAACADCRAWQQRAHAVTRRVRLGGAFLDHDLTSLVLAAVPDGAAGRRRRLTQRGGLAAIALAQLAITLPLLLLGHDHDAGPHAAHELGSFDLSLAIAFAVGAIRPALAAGLAWPCAIAAAGLSGTAIADLIDGQTLGVDEAQHLVAVVGALLLIWQARTSGGRSASGTTGAFPAEAGTRPVPPTLVVERSADAAPADRSGRLPGGGAAVLPTPDVAADAHHRPSSPPCSADGGTPGGKGNAEAVA